jgi:site-specific recombinase XerD
MKPIDLPAMLASFELALRAERKSAATVKTYRDGVRGFLRWCETTGTEPELTRLNTQQFLADLTDRGAEGNTALTWLKGLRQFSAWLAAEGETDNDPIASLKPPQVDKKIIETLDADQIKALIKACAGRRLQDRRDEAIVRLMVETGARAAEVVNLQIADVDLGRSLITIRRGKGGKGRIVPFGPQTAIALDRYLRGRRSAGLGDTGPLWVGKGGSFGYYGLDYALKARAAAAAGIEGFHCHLLRHTMATRWKAAHGSDDGLMAIAGWASRTMIDRYTGAAAAGRAADEARTLSLGDL